LGLEWHDVAVIHGSVQAKDIYFGLRASYVKGLLISTFGMDVAVVSTSVSYDNDGLTRISSLVHIVRIMGSTYDFNHAECFLDIMATLVLIVRGKIEEHDVHIETNRHPVLFLYQRRSRRRPVVILQVHKILGRQVSDGSWINLYTFRIGRCRREYYSNRLFNRLEPTTIFVYDRPTTMLVRRPAYP
jgi:hypothetical protein